MGFILRLLAVRMVLILALSPAILISSMLVREALINIWGKAYFKYTYIESIDTTTYGSWTKEILKEFNSYGKNKIITFDKIKYGRPVMINDMPDYYESANPRTLGSTWPGFTQCVIWMRKGQSYVLYRETLIHEYIHCMNYNHTNDEYDLMYPSANFLDKEKSIRQYAVKVLKYFYE